MNTVPQSHFRSRPIAGLRGSRELVVGLALLGLACDAGSRHDEPSAGSSSNASAGSDRVEMRAMASQIGWMLYFPLAQGVTRAEVRIGSDLQPRPLVNNSLTLPFRREPTTLEVSWVDAGGQPRGPFTYTLEPRAAAADFAMEFLRQQPLAWVMLREMSGVKLIYVSTLLTYRCGIEKMVYGVNTMSPDLPIVLAECDVMDPMSVPHEATSFVELPANTEFVSVQLTYFDHSISSVERFDTFDRN